MSHVKHCPKCNEVVVKSMGPEVKIRGKVTLVRNGKVFTVCKSCNSEVTVPLVLDETMYKSLLSSAKHNNIRLWIKK